MTDREDLVASIKRACMLTGSFTTRSGAVVSKYFDKYLLEADPRLVASVVDEMATLIPEDTEVLAGLELGAIPLVTLLSQRTGRPAAFVRKHAKEYGTRKLAEGARISGKNVCIVEDVTTTGGQVILSAKALRELGAQIDCAIFAIVREQTAVENLQRAGLTVRSVLWPDDVADDL